jgi:hypothetical protein
MLHLFDDKKNGNFAPDLEALFRTYFWFELTRGN